MMHVDSVLQEMFSSPKISAIRSVNLSVCSSLTVYYRPDIMKLVFYYA